MAVFPVDTESVRHTLVRAFELRSQRHEVEIVRSADIELVWETHDNWDGGIDIYSLNLRVPLEIFVQHEGRLPDMEKRLLTTVQNLFRGTPGVAIESVLVSPANLSSNGYSEIRPTATEAMPSWCVPETLRLFISHCASHRSEVAQLQDQLTTFGVSSFVAHSAIEPNAE